MPSAVESVNVACVCLLDYHLNYDWDVKELATEAVHNADETEKMLINWMHDEYR